MKNIYTLVDDIYNLMEKRDGWFSQEIADTLGADIARRLRVQLNEEAPRRTLRLSRMGPICPKALWGSIHAPDEAEAFPPWASIKFSYGHILEALVLTLAKAAGHEVTGEQDEIILDGITGHRDCVIDGCIVDVKSSTTLSFQKFKDKTIGLEGGDPFGYLDQLDAYLLGSANDPLVRNKEYAYLLVVDKQLGHLTLYEHRLRENSIRTRIEEHKRTVALATPPACECGTIAEGKSGNIKLDIKASYNGLKYFCKPTLRTFRYAKGPVYLTHVERQPDVPEYDRRGNRVY